MVQLALLPTRVQAAQLRRVAAQRRTRSRTACSATMRVLNLEPASSSGAAADPLALSTRLQQLILALKSEFVREDGTGVDYAAARGSAAFAEYCLAARDLQLVEVEALGDEAERRCFFINLYNALTIAGLVTTTPLPESPQKVADFYNSVAYRVGSRTLTLNDIEHGILRGNGVQPASRKPHWAADDERARLALPLDPRIHFALNCGAKSCPPIRVLTPGNLEFGLKAAAAGFLENHTEVDEQGVELSSLLLWYGRDFGDTQEAVLSAVCAQLPPASAKRAALSRLLEQSCDKPMPLSATLWNGAVSLALPMFMRRGPVNVRYAPYDWSLNSA